MSRHRHIGMIAHVDHRKSSLTAAITRLLADVRPCTCHPDDNPPDPCEGRFALTECRTAALRRPAIAVDGFED